MAPIRTKVYPGFFSSKESTELYEHLKKTYTENAKKGVEPCWSEGVKSKKGHTRLACSQQLGYDIKVTNFINRASTHVNKSNIQHLGVYINYYQDGNDYTPNHSHPKQFQIVISLGATRTLNVGKKSYKLNNGDFIIFGSSVHGVPKEPEVKDGRISIATFSLCLDKLPISKNSENKSVMVDSKSNNELSKIIELMMKKESKIIVVDFDILSKVPGIKIEKMKLPQDISTDEVIYLET
ncbi:MAG: hypothetical protein Solumvirus1_19 [Solumvirus sp.]|uniref:Uncharacterized protein n=1 Tax=Solumvirus sp. TaxID=2487773 RepID=A0A3G5AHS9_9VIRU|nr:MAG: hypothetical protein Solumvirus1_19 [Solumvirus sp.]